MVSLNIKLYFWGGHVREVGWLAIKFLKSVWGSKWHLEGMHCKLWACQSLTVWYYDCWTTRTSMSNRIIKEDGYSGPKKCSWVHDWFMLIKLCFQSKTSSNNANSLIPARLGVRWNNTTRYTLKYWSQCNSCDGGCSAGGITLFSVAIHECWAKLWSLHRVRASLTTAVLSQMQSPYMKRLCTACYRWYTLRTPHICDFAQSVESRCRFWRCNGLKQWVN